jgi:hypothetical protein
MYNNQYHFFLEKRDENMGFGPFLKYGRKGKNVSNVLDLSSTDTNSVGNGVIVVKESSSTTRFKIMTGACILHLKADSNNQREQWI